MTVKGPAERRSQAQRSAATVSALLAAGRVMFTEHGFSGAGREDIARAAGVTRGALYHHFPSKQALFAAVVEDVERDLTARLVEAAMAGRDPRDCLRRGCLAFLDAALDPSVRQIVLLDAPAVLGWEAWREIDARYGLALLRESLRDVYGGDADIDALAHLLLGALNEAAMLVARADNTADARTRVGETVERLLERL